MKYLVALTVLLLPTLALAAPARRAERHSDKESAALRKGPSEIPVIIRGRSARPQVVIEIHKAEHSFAVGTAHLSPRSRPFLKRGDRW